jgi:hypothetical protein
MSAIGHGTSADTFQEGSAPVQSFVSPAVPVLPGAALEPRRGRPARNGQETVRTGKEGVCVQPIQATPPGQTPAIAAEERGDIH